MQIIYIYSAITQHLIKQTKGQKNQNLQFKRSE